MVMPARLDLVLVDDHVSAGQRFHVRAVPRDRDGRELEIGKWTQLEWRTDGPVVVDNDPSSAEFGLASGAFGIGGFRASAATGGTIQVRMGDATGTLHVEATPWHRSCPTVMLGRAARDGRSCCVALQRGTCTHLPRQIAAPRVAETFCLASAGRSHMGSNDSIRAAMINSDGLLRAAQLRKLLSVYVGDQSQ